MSVATAERSSHYCFTVNERKVRSRDSNVNARDTRLKCGTVMFLAWDRKAKERDRKAKAERVGQNVAVPL